MALAVVGLLIPSAIAGTTTKPGLVIVTPTSMSAGATVSLQIAITNEADPQSLGSANLTPPAGFSLFGLSSSVGDLSLSGSTIQLRNLNLAPSQSVTVTGQLTAPCAVSDTAWAVRIKQSNSFNGPPGNDFVLDVQAPDVSSTSTTVSGGCVLVFTRQPASAITGQAITSTAYNTGAAPVEVQVQDGNGNLVSSSAAITLGIGQNPGGALLDGTTTVNAVGGIADFSAISIGTPGIGYSLGATSLGIASTESGLFDISDVAVSCASGSTCTGSESNNTTSVNVSATSGGTDTVLTISLLGGSGFQCAGYTANSTPTEFNVAAGDRFKTVTIRLSKTVVNQIPENGAAHFQVCYVTPNASFYDRSGDLVSAGTAGLLPDCNGSRSNAPCTLSRTKNKAGDVIVTFLAPAGDPRGRV